MLIVSRTKNEWIVLGSAWVCVLAILGRKVRLGIVAPGEPVHRGEVYDAIVLKKDGSLHSKVGTGTGCLVLSRREDEAIIIGPLMTRQANRVVTVVEIRGNKVRIGCDAPREVPIHRGEIFLANVCQDLEIPFPQEGTWTDLTHREQVLEHMPEKVLKQMGY